MSKISLPCESVIDLAAVSTITGFILLVVTVDVHI